MQCPIDRASLTSPLNTLLRAAGDRQSNLYDHLVSTESPYHHHLRSAGVTRDLILRRRCTQHKTCNALSGNSLSLLLGGVSVNPRCYLWPQTAVHRQCIGVHRLYDIRSLELLRANLLGCSWVSLPTYCRLGSPPYRRRIFTRSQGTLSSPAAR